MKKLLLSILCLSVFSLVGCQQKPQDEKLALVKHAIENAEYQLSALAAEFDTLQGFPRSLMPKFKEVKPRDWTSGFFPGSLWIISQLTGNEALEKEALKFTARMDGMQHFTGTHDLGFMIFCSYGRQQSVLHDQASKQVIVDAAKSLSTRFHPEVGVIRSWDFGEWNYPVIIDNMMNLEMLFWASDVTGDKTFSDIAVKHADKTLQNHFREDASSYHVVSYKDDGSVESQGTFQGYSDSSAWARGQAWGLYGYTLCYRFTKDERYLHHAQRIAELVMNHPATPEDRIPYWDYNAPDIPSAPRDASAAAVMSSALFELQGYVDEATSQRYFDYGETLLMNLSQPQYLAEKDTNGHFVLMHSVGHWPAHSEIDTPINYADYYYLEALERYLDLRGIDAKTL